MGEFEPPELVKRIMRGEAPDPYEPAPPPDEPDTTEQLPVGDTRPVGRGAA